MRQKYQDNHYSTHKVPEHELQEGKISREGLCGSADDRKRRGFGSDDRNSQRPPRRGAVAQEVVADGTLCFAKCDAEQRYAGKVRGNNGEVQSRQAHRNAGRS